MWTALWLRIKMWTFKKEARSTRFVSLGCGNLWGTQRRKLGDVIWDKQGPHTEEEGVGGRDTWALEFQEAAVRVTWKTKSHLKHLIHHHILITLHYYHSLLILIQTMIQTCRAIPCSGKKTSKWVNEGSQVMNTGRPVKHSSCPLPPFSVLRAPVGLQMLTADWKVGSGAF